MQVEFWGTRGSVAAPGPFTVRYGGNTSCVAVTLTDGTLLVLDAGTGIRRLGHALAARPPVTVHLFLSHCHWDHIQGFPFFAPAYCPNAHLSIYGYPAARQKIRKTMTDQMEGAYFPVDFSQLSAKIEFIDLWQDTLRLGTSRITLVETNHPGGGVGFRIQEGDRSLVYLTDNELGTAGNGRFTGFCHGATLLIHDAHYTPEEMETHRGWGHSSYQEVLALARAAEVQQVALFHHDPERTDDAIDAMVAACRAEMARRGDRFTCFAAAEGAVLSL
ncbi:MAG: MBL fold metallo-hydrolase [Armatimonadetes bacterium]|nr:MBL fold metallo-hydrolase [Armatimonadota bacterium]